MSPSLNNAKNVLNGNALNNTVHFVVREVDTLTRVNVWDSFPNLLGHLLLSSISKDQLMNF